jgi:hypothetical protein
VGGVEPPLFRLSIEHSSIKLHPFWGNRGRTYAWRDQNPLPLPLGYTPFYYQKFVQKKLKTLRVTNLEYHSFLILMGLVKINAINHKFVKNFRLGLFELFLRYRLLRDFKKKKLYFDFFGFPVLFV